MSDYNGPPDIHTDLDARLTLAEQAEISVGHLEVWHRTIVRHWGAGARGWAPAVATAVLSRSRLDRQSSLCVCLRMWLDPEDRSDGRLILSWTNLGTLVEGTLKFFLSVFAADYSKVPKTNHKGKTIDPDLLKFDLMRHVFRDEIFSDSQQPWDAWLERVQQRRNAIHAYKNVEIGTHEEFLAAIVEYRAFASELDSQIPWS